MVVVGPGRHKNSFSLTREKLFVLLVRIQRGEERRGESIGEHGLNMTHSDTCECLCWGSCIEIIDITAAPPS